MTSSDFVFFSGIGIKKNGDKYFFNIFSGIFYEQGVIRKTIS